MVYEGVSSLSNVGTDTSISNRVRESDGGRLASDDLHEYVEELEEVVSVDEPLVVEVVKSLVGRDGGS